MAAYWSGCSDFQICKVLLLCREQKKYCHDVLFGGLIFFLLVSNYIHYKYFSFKFCPDAN